MGRDESADQKQENSDKGPCRNDRIKADLYGVRVSQKSASAILTWAKRIQNHLKTIRDWLRRSLLVWVVASLIAVLAGVATIRSYAPSAKKQHMDQVDKVILGLKEIREEQVRRAEQVAIEDPQLQELVKKFLEAVSLAAKNAAIKDMEAGDRVEPGIRALRNAFEREESLLIYLPKDVSTKSSAAVRQRLSEELTTAGLPHAQFGHSRAEAHLSNPYIVYSCGWRADSRLEDMTSTERIALDVLTYAILESYAASVGEVVEVKVRSATSTECDNVEFPQGLIVFLD